MVQEFPEETLDFQIFIYMSLFVMTNNVTRLGSIKDNTHDCFFSKEIM